MKGFHDVSLIPLHKMFHWKIVDCLMHFAWSFGPGIISLCPKTDMEMSYNVVFSDMEKSYNVVNRGLDKSCQGNSVESKSSLYGCWKDIGIFLNIEHHWSVMENKKVFKQYVNASVWPKYKLDIWYKLIFCFLCHWFQERYEQWSWLCWLQMFWNKALLFLYCIYLLCYFVMSLARSLKLQKLSQ